MGIKQAFTLALKSLASSKMRSILTMLGIIIGVAAVILIVSVVNGMTQDIVGRFEEMGANTISVTIIGRGGNRAVSIDQMRQLAEDNPTVLNGMSPVINITNVTVKNGTESLTPTTCVAANEDYARISALTVEQGRALQYIDDAQRLNNCVIGTYIAKELFGNTNVVGQTIKLNGTNFQIVGLLEETAKGEEASKDDAIYIPHSVAGKMGLSAGMTSYVFNAVSKEVSNDAQVLIEQYLQKIFQSTDAYRVRNMSSLIDTINDMTKKMSLVLACVAGVSLLVGGIGIMNIMLVSVTERTREIGIRKALGATPWDIMSQFVVEAITTSCLGGVIGILIGVGGSYICQLFSLKISISIPAILISFCVSAAIGIAFGYFPAKKASRLNPIDALRYD